MNIILPGNVRANMEIFHFKLKKLRIPYYAQKEMEQTYVSLHHIHCDILFLFQYLKIESFFQSCVVSNIVMRTFDL